MGEAEKGREASGGGRQRIRRMVGGRYDRGRYGTSAGRPKRMVVTTSLEVTGE